MWSRGILLRLGNNRTLTAGAALLGIVQESSCLALSARSEGAPHPRAGCEPGVPSDYRDTYGTGMVISLQV